MLRLMSPGSALHIMAMVKRVSKRRDEAPPPPRRWRSGNLGRLVVTATGDLDGDGRHELVAAAGRELKVYDFRLGTYMLAHSQAMPQDVLSVALCDLDGDGWLEVCTGTRDRLSVFAGRGHRVELAWETLDYPNAYFRRVSAGDLDGDGRDELVGAASGAQTLYVFKLVADGRGGFELAEQGRTYLGGLAWTEVSPGCEEVVASTQDGYVDIFVPGVLLREPAPRRTGKSAGRPRST